MKHDFANFKRTIQPLHIERTPLDVRAYNRYGYYKPNAVADYDVPLEEIERIIRSGDLEAIRGLSKYYYRTNSIYRNNIDFLASLPLYDTVVIPIFDSGKGSSVQITKAFYNACHFVDKLDVKNTFTRITKHWLIEGVYNGILRHKGDKYTIQDLPLRYCRTRFRDFNNLNILEFDLRYFEDIKDEVLRAESLATFPEIVQREWKRWKADQRTDSWVEIPGADGGICFTFPSDPTPLLIATIPDLYKLKDGIAREEKRDENELYKLLIQRMPVDSDGELVFELDEVAEIHASVAKMLQDVDTVDVLTTFGETSLENLQDSSSASQSADRIDKYRQNAWDALGRGRLLFNPDNSSSLSYSIKKDESLMRIYLNVYATWIKFHLNDKFVRPNLTFDFEILPTTVFNWSDMKSSYFTAAQYGYSKMFAGVASGIKQLDQISTMIFENDFLKMSEKMIPLQSSYTTPGGSTGNEKNSKNSGENTQVQKSPKDLNNTGGRPELPDEQKSEKTQANIAAAG